MATEIELLKAEAIEEIAADLAALTAADRAQTGVDRAATGANLIATEDNVTASEAAVVDAQTARDEAEQSAGIVTQATSVAGLTDPTTLTAGDGGLVLGAGDDAIDGYYEVEANSPNEWVRIRATGLAGKLDEAVVAVSPSVSKVVSSTAVGYIKPTWLAPQDSFPDDVQTLISPLAEIPEGWRDTGDMVGMRKVVARDLWVEVAARMAKYRVDIVGIGDSNQLFEGHGWDSGFAKALVDAGAPMWATGLVSQNENSGNGAGQGYLYNRSGPLIGSTSGAPAELEAFLNKGIGALSPAFYTYVADGGSVASSTACGLQLGAGCPIDNTAALEYDIHWGGFTSGSGQFRPQLRLDESPYSEITGALPIVSTNTGSYGMNRTTSAAPADPTRAGKAIAGRL